MASEAFSLRVAPAWSPDGRSIAFISPDHALSVVPASGGHPRRVGHIHGLTVDWQPTPASPVAGCRAPPGSTLLTSSPEAVVTSDGGPAVPFMNFAPVAYMGCRLSSGRERLLTRYDFQSEDVETGGIVAATAGSYAALASFQTDNHYGGSEDSVAVYDLQTGKRLRNLGGETISCQGYSCFTSVDGLMINSQGFTAAHMTINTYGRPNVVTDETIQVSDSASVRTLDSAAPSSEQPSLTNLSLSGGTLSWRHGGIPESAQLH